MASLKEIKTRISSVKSTRQITSAMKMVASAKLHRSQSKVEEMRPYQRKLNKMISNFLDTEQAPQLIYTSARPVKKVAILAFSSNTSLCGAFNSNVAKILDKTVKGYSTLGKENILVLPIGRKIEEATAKMNCTVENSYQDIAESPSFDKVVALSEKICNMFATGDIDKVEIIYHHFKSVGTQKLLHDVFLPLNIQDIKSIYQEEQGSKKDNVYNKDYIIEPSLSQLLSDLLPVVLNQRLFSAFMESNASEHAARMLAMQTATDNADDLIQELTKQYNKVRQQAITNELLDIIGGSFK